MKRISAKLMILPILAVLVFFSFSSSTTVGQAGGHSVKLRIRILSAQYGDYDFDGHEDDIQLIFDMTLINQDDENRSILLFLEIWKPSGTGHMALFDVWMSSVTSRFYINAYNIATEPGWYYASLIGFYFGDDYLIIAYSAVVFDPPTEESGGQPDFVIGKIPIPFGPPEDPGGQPDETNDTLP